MMTSNEKESAKEVYKRAFEVLKGISGWDIGIDKWMFTSEVPAPLTRDEAFKNVCERSR